MMIQDHHTAPVALTDLGWSLACHAALLLLLGLLTLLIVHPPEVGVEAATVATEFQLLDAPASESSPSQSADGKIVPSEVLASSIEPTPLKSEPEPPVPRESQSREIPPSPVADIPDHAAPELPVTPKHAESSRHSKPRSRASASLKGAREALPDYLRNPPPSYPEPARLAHEEGVVVLLVEVGHSGNPTGVRLRQSSGYAALDQAAIRAVRDWKFRPATAAGMVVASSVSIPVRFELH